MNALANKVLVINLSISTFTGEKVDRDVSEQVAANHNTTAREAGRFSKQIIGRAALEPIKNVAARARNTHYKMTLPFSDSGSRLLSVAGYFDYCGKLAEMREMYSAAVEEFISEYPKLIETAKTRLNGMFNEGDYPTVAGLRNRFSFDVSASPLPSAHNWLLDMAEEEMDKLRHHQSERLDHTIGEAMKDVYRRLAEVAEKLATKLADDEGIFRDSLVENVNDLVGLLPSLNLTEDPALTTIGNELAALVKRGPGILRVDKDVREATAVAAQAIYDKAAAFM